MCGKQGTRRSWPFLPLLALLTTMAHADPPARYRVGGSAGATLWGLGNQPGTEAVVFAFSRATAEREANTPPGPRMAFSVTAWTPGSTGWVHRQWYGDAAVPKEGLTIGPGLAEGTLAVTVLGTLEEQSDAGVAVQRNVPGRVEVRWVARGAPGNTTAAYIYQTPAYRTTLQLQGEGRAATATGSVTVEALGEPISLWGFGSLTAIVNGTLEVPSP
jgi:hypothetical protein